MPHVPPLDPTDADDDVRELYSDFQRRMGFPAPLNFIKTQGHSIATARGTWGLVQHVLVGGQLPRTLKEMLFTAVSRDRQCNYCEAAHLACCRMLGVEAARIAQLSGGHLDELTPRRVRDIVDFGVRCARDPQGLREEDFEVLRGHGLSHSEILEIISMAALAVYANTLADATGMEPDAMFSEL